MPRHHRSIQLGAATAAALAATILSPPAAHAATTVTVAADGSGNYTTVQAAVNAVPTNNSSTFTINIKAGTYRGTVNMPPTSRASAWSAPGRARAPWCWWRRTRPG